MSQLAPFANYGLIEDQLDAVGQKYRGFLLVRGIMLFVATALVVSMGAGLLGFLLREGVVTMLVLAGWLAAVLAAGAWFVLKPLLMRPRPLEVARLVETKIPDLYNGLTNSVQLAAATDLHSNPWLPAIFDEVLVATRRRSIDQAVRIADLKPLAIRLGGVMLASLLLLAIFPRPFMQGWKQLFRPTTFVPAVGRMEIVDIQPKEATLIAGQPLEIVVTAKGPDTPNATLLFDNGAEPASLTPAATPEGLLRYTYRMEHVDAPMKFRVEVGGTQSPWYAVNVVREIKLTDLSLLVTPPAYTKQSPSTIAMRPDEIGKTPIAVPQGSRVEVRAGIDIPVAGAMLQAGDAQPIPMTASSGGQRFSAELRLLEDTPVALLLTQENGQIVARLPETSLGIQVTKDIPPTLSLRWPTQDIAVPPDQELKLLAELKDDYGVSAVRVLMAEGQDDPLRQAHEEVFGDTPALREFSYVLDVKPEQRKHGQVVRIQLEASDNRDLREISAELGAQTVTTPVITIKFQDAEQIAREEKEKADKLRERLMQMLKTQQELHTQAVAWQAGDVEGMQKIGTGQADLRLLMQQTAQTFEFDDATKVVQKTLLVLVYNAAKDAVDLSSAVVDEPDAKEARKLNRQLHAKQRRIIETLESLLAMLNPGDEEFSKPTTRPGADLPSKAEALKKLSEDLKEFMKQQQKVLDQTAPLAKKPVDNWTDQDKKLLDDLIMAQDKLDAFMQSKVNDFSKLTEQDMSNASLLSQLYEIYSEVTMAKDALTKKETEMATALEDNAMGLAQEMNMNIEKWLADAPDRDAWKMEDPVTKHDLPMPELPAELEDIVGELMENQEDLFEEMEDANANWAQSEGSGWDALDGPIESMSAQGVTGNALPNDNDLGGRSGEGRSARSQGEMVEESASGKGGRNTPTRLDPTPFQQGQIKDESKDPVGGATGGGKISGQGGQGLEGPTPPPLDVEMARLANKQAQLRNNAERLALEYQLGRYDNFKLQQAIALMRRVESDIQANRYQNALRRKDVLLDHMETSHLLLSGRIHVQQDTSPQMSRKMEDAINDAMKGQLPAAWSDALKEYYRKLATE
jgi:hypothetical protein